MSAARLQTLIKQAQDSTPDSVRAYAALVSEFQDRLLRFLVLQGNSYPDAEDICQQTFVQCWQKLHTYNPRWQFSTWLYRIAGRIAMRHGSKIKTESLNELGNASVQHQHDLLNEMLADSIWASAEQLLTRPAFLALWLHYGEGFSGAEVARILNRSSIWVRVSLHRSKQQLQQHLNSDGIPSNKTMAYTESRRVP